MRVLITGGAGFVGRHFATRLFNEGHHITGVDIAGWPLQREYSWGTVLETRLDFYAGDFRAWMRGVGKSDDFDLIIHCAAIVGGRLNIDGDPLSVATNLSVDSEFFNWVVRAKSKPKIVFFSSSAVYPLELQTRTNHPLLVEQFVIPQHQLRLGMPDNTYGWSKLSGEVLAQCAVKNYGADCVIYRPFGGYGEDQALTYPFPSIIKRIVDGENPVTVWGSGDQQRDFIHIEDIVDAVLATMNVLKPGEALNLGTGMGLSFKNLARIASDVLGIPVDIVNDATKPEGVFARVADVTKLSTLWKIPDPMSRLCEGIKGVAKHLLTGTK